jgi:hypothetical protein
MEEEEEHFDEQLSRFLWHCYTLKKKAEAAQGVKKSLPTWMRKLLDDNKPSKN